MLLVKANRNATIDFTCPNCGHKFTKTIGWMEQNPEFACEADCGFGFKADEFIGKLDKALSDMEREFRGMKFKF